MHRIPLLPILILVLLSALCVTLRAADKTPQTGELAQDFELKTPDGFPVKLSLLTEKGPVAIVVLRGYPGAQNTICKRQVINLVSKASSFMDSGATVVLVYPGNVQKLEERAQEFLDDIMMPANFRLVIDPDYLFANQYGLRWESKNETVYPAAFVVNTKGMVTFAQISKSHGNRAKAEDLLKALSIK